MKNKPRLLLFLLFIVLIFNYGCNTKTIGAEQLLNKYFSTAIKQDYASAYTCYYKEYQTRITKDEYIKHRKEASVLLAYKIISLKQTGNTAQAEVLLTFAPSKKFDRTKPVTVKAHEDLIKEQGEWRIKIW